MGVEFLKTHRFLREKGVFRGKPVASLTIPQGTDLEEVLVHVIRANTCQKVLSGLRLAVNFLKGKGV